MFIHLQNIYLLGNLGLWVAGIFISIVQYNGRDCNLMLFLTGGCDDPNYFKYVSVAWLLAIATSIISIYSYRQIRKQWYLVNVLIIIECIAVIMLMSARSNIMSDVATPHYGLHLILTLIGIFLVYLARKKIRKNIQALEEYKRII